MNPKEAINFFVGSFLVRKSMHTAQMWNQFPPPPPRLFFFSPVWIYRFVRADNGLLKDDPQRPQCTKIDRRIVENLGAPSFLQVFGLTIQTILTSISIPLVGCIAEERYCSRLDHYFTHGDLGRWFLVRWTFFLQDSLVNFSSTPRCTATQSQELRPRLRVTTWTQPLNC